MVARKTKSKSSTAAKTTKATKSGKAAKANKAEAVLDQLEKQYGPVDLSVVADTLDLTIFGHLVIHMPLDQAVKALQAFKTKFVDWNEVRISTVKEVQEVVKLADDPLEVALTLKDFLHYLFTVYHHVGLDFLREKNISEIRSFFKKGSNLGESVVHLILERLKEYPVVPLETEMQDCLVKLGVLKKSATPLQKQKDLYGMLTPDRVLPVFCYVAEHTRQGCPKSKVR